LSLFSSSTIAKANWNIPLFTLKAIAIDNFPSYHPYKYILSTLISGLYYLKPSIQGPNDKKKHLLKTIVPLRYPSGVQSVIVPEYNLFITNNNLGNFSKNSSCEPKRCSIMFNFATHALSYDILYL
jgi:hypothetical protein